MSAATERELRSFGWRLVGAAIAIALLVFGPLIWTAVTTINSAGRINALEERDQARGPIPSLDNPRAERRPGGDALQSPSGGQQPEPGPAPGSSKGTPGPGTGSPADGGQGAGDVTVIIEGDDRGAAGEEPTATEQQRPAVQLPDLGDVGLCLEPVVCTGR